MRTVDEILGELKKLPVFKMSLGSKELFHSNFLEFLWEVNHDMFCAVINDLLGKTKLTLYETSGIARELKNFDICVYHTEKYRKKDKSVYDLIIENKVKSIPNKKQLDGYVEKVESDMPEKYQNKAKYLLLSLMTDFADRNEIEMDQRWAITNYDALKDAIETRSGEAFNKGLIDTRQKLYIDDYCEFLGLMHELKVHIVPDPDEFMTQELFPENELKKFRECRLHDLYIKIRCGKFIEHLTEELNAKGLTVEYTDEAGDSLRKKLKDQAKQKNPISDVYVNIGINQGVGQIAAFIYDEKTEYFNEVVIQGDQYRHGINVKVPVQSSKIKSQEEIWKKVDGPNNAFLKFFPCNTKIYPEKPKNTRTAPFLGYNHDYIYKYTKISEWQTPTVKNLLEVMADDITAQVR